MDPMNRFALAAFLFATPALAQQPSDPGTGQGALPPSGSGVHVTAAATHARDPEFVPVEKLESRKTDPAELITSISIRHAKPQDIMDKVGAALAATTVKAEMATVGGKVLVQGPGPAVYSAYLMVRLIDVAPPMYMEVVALKHSRAADLVETLEPLVAGLEPTVVIAAHETTNGLVISGPRSVVHEAVAVAVQLDELAKK